MKPKLLFSRADIHTDIHTEVHTEIHMSTTVIEFPCQHRYSNNTSKQLMTKYSLQSTVHKTENGNSNLTQTFRFSLNICADIETGYGSIKIVAHVWLEYLILLTEIQNNNLNICADIETGNGIIAHGVSMHMNICAEIHNIRHHARIYKSLHRNSTL